MISIRRAVFSMCLLLITGPLVLFWVWPHSRLVEQELGSAQEHHLLIARTLSKSLERYQQDLTSVVGFVAERAGDRATLANSHRLLRPLNVRHVLIADRQSGEITAAAEGTKPAPTGALPMPLIASLRSIATEGGIAFSGVTLGADGVPVFYLVRAAGSALAIATVDTGYVVDLGRSISFGVNGHAAIVDQYGRLLAHPIADWHRTAKDISGLGIVKLLRGGEAGVSEFFSPAYGTDMIAGYAPVRGTGWGVMVPQPIAEMRAATDNVRRNVLAIFSAGLLIAALIAIRAGFIFTAPLHRLGEGARRMAEGELGVRVKVGGRLTPRELVNLTHSFNDMAEKLETLSRRSTELRERAERANQSKTDFVRTVTHELRSPVNAIIGFSDLLTGRSAARVTPEMRERYLRDITAGAHHLLSLVNDLLDLSKMESGQYDLSEGEFWVDEITMRATRYVENQARERDVAVTVAFDGEPPMIRGDERALFQSLLNLVTNAVRYGNAGGNVAIAVGGKPNGDLAITVSDDGPGISADDLERVMLPFQRARNATARTITGTGLGLPIVKRLIELHGGDFKLSSKVGAGTVATITLPAARVHVIDGEADSQHEPAPHAPSLSVAHAA